jgi:predicted SprT family Zn-dependent metalloprotease
MVLRPDWAHISIATAQPSGGRREMHETCDRCGPSVRAVYRVDREGELYLCLHCASQLWAALFAQGWIISLTDERALAPQAS